MTTMVPRDAPPSPRRGRDRTPVSRPRTPPDSLIEVRFRSDRAEDAFSDILSDPHGGVRLIACRASPPRSGNRLVRWLELETTSSAGRERLRQLTKRAGPTDVSVASPSVDRALVRLAGPLPGVCAAVFAAGAICLSCPLLAGDPGGPGASVRLLVPRNGEARRLRRELSRRLDGHFTLERAGRLRSPAGLTRRQEQAFRTALELGYFSYPRRADLGMVARHLGVSRSTTLELLRHAIREMGRRRFPARDRDPGSE